MAGNATAAYWIRTAWVVVCFVVATTINSTVVWAANQEPKPITTTAGSVAADEGEPAAGGAAEPSIDPDAPPPELWLRLNIPAFELSLYAGETLVRRYPVAIGKPSSPSPTGCFRIVYKAKNPTWIPTDGSSAVPPGPSNPLGSRWMGLSKPHYGIHSTNAPRSIGTAASLGCFRMLPEDAEHLYDQVPVGTRVEIVYERFQLIEADGSVKVRVFADIYRRGTPAAEEIEAKVSDALAGVSATAGSRKQLVDAINERLASGKKGEVTVVLAIEEPAQQTQQPSPAPQQPQPPAPLQPAVAQVSVNLNGIMLPANAILIPAGLEIHDDLTEQQVHCFAIEIGALREALATSLRLGVSLYNDYAYVGTVATPIFASADRKYMTISSILQALRGNCTYSISDGKIAIDLAVERR